MTIKQANLRLNKQERLLNVLAEQMKLPLMQIARMAELGQLNNPGQNLNEIELTADSALRLIDSYLLSTKLVRAQNYLQLEPVSVSAVLNDSAHELSKLANQYDCELQLHLAGRYEPVMAHRAGLEAALTSLGYAFIEAQASLQHKNNPVIKLAAHRGKTGIVAGLFTGSDDNLSSSLYRRGHGLYGHARQPLNSISASSSAGIFVADSLLASMSAKLRVAHHPKINRLSCHTNGQPSNGASLMAKILLIEPDIKLGKIYQEYLELVGHQTAWRLTAQTALNHIDKFKPDLIILELQLPAHNGVEFLYEFRSYKDWQNIPVIIHSQVPPILRAISPMLWSDLGIVSYLYKPTTKLRDILHAIDSAPLAV